MACKKCLRPRERIPQHWINFQRGDAIATLLEGGRCSNNPVVKSVKARPQQAYFCQRVGEHGLTNI